MDNARRELLERMEKALKRMELDGAEIEQCEHFLRFKSKYEAIKNGSDYTVKNVAPYLIAYVGSLIPNVNINSQNQYIKPKYAENRHTIALKIQNEYDQDLLNK
ncbi:hypothetical protein M3649_03975 [Ureibacillus chungkukjangi]|uniref:hypothetical protein n=1 Tax=Ureibacillus chungkukjangi TaxID=1202712 RepID=UPI00203D26C4|nr:hypothetical protein [Ureibacillus chungkukjangi]MCM3387290.1 hypothetical protein [Ureibacillus chungkukjangi]